jgi:hypothetical protein
MTRLNLLEDQKTILTAKKEALESKRGDIYVREQKAMKEVLEGFFRRFPQEVEVEVTRGSVYFKMDHPEVTYKKELFNLYLREDYDFENSKKSYTGIDLSYYTTSTKGDDVWELKRLQMLGKLSEIVYEDQEKIVSVINAAVLPFKAEYKEVYDEMNEISKELRGVEDLIRVVEKEKIALELKNEGVRFKEGKNIQLKFNYSPNVKAIKLVDISKSGKKATAVFTFAHGDSTSSEENCSVQNIIDQVYGLRNDIVQPTLAE